MPQFLTPAQRFARFSAIERGDTDLPHQDKFDEEQAYIRAKKAENLLEAFAFLAYCDAVAVNLPENTS